MHYADPLYSIHEIYQPASKISGYAVNINSSTLMHLLICRATGGISWTKRGPFLQIMDLLNEIEDIFSIIMAI